MLLYRTGRKAPDFSPGDISPPAFFGTVQTLKAKTTPGQTHLENWEHEVLPRNASAGKVLKHQVQRLFEFLQYRGAHGNRPSAKVVNACGGTALVVPVKQESPGFIHGECQLTMVHLMNCKYISTCSQVIDPTILRALGCTLSRPVVPLAIGCSDWPSPRR